MGMKTGSKDRGRITRALIYTRVSKDEQAREGISLDAQLADCRRYAAQHSWVLDGEYQDVLSGTRDDRPQYQALLAEVRRLRAQGSAVTVVVAKLDRFGRRLLERVRCREELKGLGVPVHSVREGGEVSDLVANILASVAQEEVRQLGERVATVRRHIASNGWRPVGTCPWGYRWRPATEDERRYGAPKSVLDVDLETAPYVRRAFEMVAAGGTVRSVMRWAASLPSGARGGRVLGHSAVNKLVRMPVYVGRQERADGGDVLADPPQRWPALVDDVTWAKVQRRIEGHARMPRQASGEYLLTGLMRCPICGDRMSGWRIRQRSPRYRCQRKAPTCYGDSMMEPVDAKVLDDVTTVVSVVAAQDATLQKILRREWDSLRQPCGDAARVVQAMQALDRAAAKSRQRLTDAAVLLVDGTLDKDGYERLRDKATADLEAAEAEMTRLRGMGSAPELPSFNDVLREAGGWAAALREADTSAVREVLAVLIERVVPTRPSVGRYEAQITWTPAGEALRLIASRVTTAA
jgi:site-specific DNA recombinase